MENQKITNGEPTIYDVLQAIQSFSGDMDKKFGNMDKKFNELQQEMRQGFLKINVRLDTIETRLSTVEARLDSIEKELEDIKASIAKLEKGTREDTDASAKDILTLKTRVANVERQLKIRVAA